MGWPHAKQERIQRKEEDCLRNVVSQHHRESEKYDDIVKEKDLLENLLLSTQQENERCEAELKIWKAYAKNLEKKIESYEGPHWQDNPDVPSTPVPVKVRKSGISKQPFQSAWTMPAVQDAALEKEGILAIDSNDTFTDIPHYGSTASQADLGRSHNNSDPSAERMKALTNKAKRGSATFWEYEAQIVPALVNAEKKQQRRLSLQMFSEASVRRSANEINVVLDQGDRYVENSSVTGTSPDVIETLQDVGDDLPPELTLQPEMSPPQQLDAPTDRLDSLITAFNSQIPVILTRLNDSADRIQSSEIAQQNVLLEFQTTHLAEMSKLSLAQTTAQQSISSINRAMQESNAEWREDADRREERLQRMLEEAKAQAAQLLADTSTVQH